MVVVRRGSSGGRGMVGEEGEEMKSRLALMLASSSSIFSMSALVALIGDVNGCACSSSIWVV